MSRKLTEQTICGVRLDAFAKQPTPEELGAIVAHMDSEDQAMFLIVLGEQLTCICSHERYVIQLAYVRQALEAIEERSCTGYGSKFVADLQPRPVQ